VIRPTAAVIGSGVAGLTAAYLLQRRYDVTLFEAQERLGGHAHTHDVLGADGTSRPIDSGFIVHNIRTYPNLIRLFDELGVRVRDTEMSMSVRCEGCGLEYAGARRLPGLFAQPGNVMRPRYLRLLAEVPRFHRQARRLLADPAGSEVTLGEFLAAGRYSSYFVDHFALPMVSSVWSADAAVSARYPARYLFAFLEHHGLLSVGGSPTWRTVVGGSREYVDRAVKELTEVELSSPVRALWRDGAGVLVTDRSGLSRRFDRAVVATHPDEALELLADATRSEREVLGAFRYSHNETWLHRDSSVLPRAAGARASWNYFKRDCPSTGDPVLVSYYMNRLQGLDATEDYVVTLNAGDRVAPDAVLATMTYRHPIYTPESVAAQARLPELSGPVVAFAGAYHGWGFHEDGCASGVRAAEAFGVSW
jgi:predicted NAD/FAD-binding protein